MLSTKDAAKIIGVHPNTLSSWRRSGKIKAAEYHHGGNLSTLYPKALIAEFAKEYKTQRRFLPQRGRKTLGEQGRIL